MPAATTATAHIGADTVALCALLRRTASLPLGLQIHAHVLKSLPPSPSLSNHLISLYSRLRLPLSSLLAFRLCPRPLPASTWSSLLSSLSRNSLHLAALRLLPLLLRSPLSLPARSVPPLARSAAALPHPRFALSLHSLALKTSLSSHLFAATSLLHMYSRLGLPAPARQVFDEMPRRSVVTWTAMIHAYSHHGLPHHALRLLPDLPHRLANDFAYAAAARACGEATAADLGRQVHARCVHGGLAAAPSVAAALVRLYSRCGDVDDARAVFRDAAAPNLALWNALLAACAQHGLAADAIQLFRRMRAEVGADPDGVTFLSLLHACSHAGLVEEGMSYFDLMTACGIAAEPPHYACVVDLLSRAGRLREAVGFVAGMPIQPPAEVWAALLTGSRIHGHRDAAVAAYAASRLWLSGARSSGALSLVCDAYMALGRHEEAAEARKAMRDGGSGKMTGLSWVEFGNRVHSFSCGDRSHERSAEIYAKLEELGEAMAARAGYEMDHANYAWPRDVGRRRGVGWHSEKLAVAFMLVEGSGGRPIRVMKNLRVCGECHAWLKMVTLCTGRTVVLRDNTRFHRFERGVCSCGDYW